MWITRARQPVSHTLASSSRYAIVRSVRRPVIILGQRSYSSNDHQAPASKKSSSNWIKTSLGLAGTATAAFLIYTYATSENENEAVRKLAKAAKADEDFELIQKKKSLASPGTYLWGANTYRVVDPNSKETVVKTPRKFSYFDNQVLRDLKLGETSGAAITENGDLVQWGKGFSEVDFKPTKTLTGKNLTSLCMSRDRILALSSDGTVYSLPIAMQEQSSGRKPEEKSWLSFRSSTADVSYRLLKPNLGLGEKVTAISGGMEHVLLLTSSGRVFSAASSTESYPSFGQLGIPGLKWETRPKGPVDLCHEVKVPNGAKITKIAAGDYHSLLLTKDGNALAFGDNSFGQLGMEFEASAPYNDVPTLVPIRSQYRGAVAHLAVTGIAAGGANSFFTVDVQPIITPDGEPAKICHMIADTWTCGRGIWGALGNGKWTHLQDRLTKVKALSGLVEYDERTKRLAPIRLHEISVGTTHVSAVMGNRSHLAEAFTSSLDKTEDCGLDILFWGGNENFQLGTGKRSNMSKPTHIHAPPESNSSDDEDVARLQILPRHKSVVGNRTVSMQQRVECGRHISAIYSAV